MCVHNWIFILDLLYNNEKITECHVRYAGIAHMSAFTVYN